jgi:hypothetical protein
MGALASVICLHILEKSQWNNIKYSATNEYGGGPHLNVYYVL